MTGLPGELVFGGGADGRDEAQLKKAYKKMSLKHHPDRNRGDPSATQRFQRVHDAYESFMVALPEDGAVEVDPSDKSQYDPVAAIASFKAHLRFPQGCFKVPFGFRLGFFSRFHSG